MAVQIGGLASGMDTETMIAAILEGEQAQIKTYERQLENDKAELEGWDEVSSQISKLDSSMEPLSNFETWDQKKAVSSVGMMTATADDTALNTDYNIEITQLATKTAARTNSYADATAPLNLSGTFSVEGQDVTVIAEDSLNDIAEKINQSQATVSNEEKVIAQVISGTLVLEKVNSGDRDLSLSENGTNNVLRELGIVTNTDSGGGTFNTIKSDYIIQGKNLEGNINGIDFSRKSNQEIDDVIPGVTMNFSETGTTKLEISNDTEAIKNLLTDFIETYNTAIDEIRELTQYVMEGENLTTTDEEGEEVKAETGILQGESIANNYLTRLRSSLMGSMDKNNNQDFPIETFNDMGIWFDDQEGHLKIVDEAKLDNALENNYSDVEEFFRGYGDSDKNPGIMRTVDGINDNYNDLVDGSVTIRKQMLNKEIERKEIEIDQMYEDLADYEAALWEQFSNMETAVAEINNSMQYLINSLGIDSDSDD
ncbi:flagellar filament capping protein FliD [Lentisphaerota bacterium WC36G]|nr:flagellar filament capping protein FliD [Lentisphaerae bacterium WC36]